MRMASFETSVRLKNILSDLNSHAPALPIIRVKFQIPAKPKKVGILPGMIPPQSSLVSAMNLLVVHLLML
jgi:hypothetical protein